jgi:acyl-coenzyme A synthetase/AMP-(fatty) acid ligase
VLAVLSRLPVGVSPGPVPARHLLFGALEAAASRDGNWRWLLDHRPRAVEVDAEGAVRVADLAAAARRLATVLHRSGVARGDWCAVWLDEPLDVMLAVTALTGLGAVPVALSPKLDPEQVREALAGMSHPVKLLACGYRHGDVDRHGIPVERLPDWDWVAGTEPGPVDAAGSPPPGGVVKEPGEPYVVTHTSGTTGVPKLAIQTLRSFYEQAALQRKVLRMLRMRGVLAAAISPVHVRTLSGYLGVLLSTSDVSPLICKSEDADSIAPLLRRWRPSYLETHPNTFVLWEELADTDALESVRLFLATFDAVHPRTVERLLAGSRRRRPMFIELYAQSECGPLANRIWTGGVGRDDRPLPATISGHGIGWSVPGYSRLRVVDPQGVPVKRGEPGRIQARTKGRFAGYLNFPQLFDQNLAADGWWDTGDYGAVGARGEMHLLDRQVERLSQARSAVALEDILLHRLPELTEVVVMEIGDRLVPVVTSRDGTPVFPAAWAEATRGLLSLTPPEQLDWAEIPRTATGKVRRRVLRQKVMETMERHGRLTMIDG